MPSVMYWDNAKTFFGAGVMLQNYLGHLAPEWKLIVPRSPWWGGWWERLIRSAKSGLRKSLGSRCLTRAELETVLFDIEVCINSRPLTLVGNGVDCSNALTPESLSVGAWCRFSVESLGGPKQCVSNVAI